MCLCCIVMPATALFARANLTAPCITLNMRVTLVGSISLSCRKKEQLASTAAVGLLLLFQCI
jgi:hypothetical protein